MSEFITDTGYTIQVNIGVWNDERTVISIEKKDDLDAYVEVALTKEERAQLITNLAFKS